MKDADRDIVIVGAGIVGICAAASLSEAGRNVTVVDRLGICEGTSSGNAAALAFSDVLPLVQKGMMRQVPRWLMDPLGPLSIPPAYLPALMPWLLRFWRAGRPVRYEAALAAQGSMMKLAEAEWAGLMERSRTRAMLNEDGGLELYESERGFRDSLPGWEAKARLGIAFRHVERGEIASFQPGLSDRFVRATFVPGWKNVSDPKTLGKAVWAYAEGLGARFVEGEARSVAGSSEAGAVDLGDGRIMRARNVVICAGAWSHRLASGLGDRLPLEAERGYNTTLPPGAFDVRCQLMFSEHGFVVSRLSSGIRVGGAVELGGVERGPNMRRARAMLEKAAMFMPGLKTAGGREWMGHRPSLPDSLPVIGRSRASAAVLYAFGHGHLGLTQAAAAGRLVRDLAEGREPAIDLAPFSPRRFQ
jgi:D-amino-acid dehydrogenase